MAGVFDFTIDNLGSPDQYTVGTVCKKIRIREKDRTVASLSGYEVFIPASGATFTSRLPGEEHELMGIKLFQPGDKPFGLQSTGASSVVFTVTEE